MVSDFRVKWCDSERCSLIQLPAPPDSHVVSSRTHHASPTSKSLGRPAKRQHIFTHPTVVISNDEIPTDSDDVPFFGSSDDLAQSDYDDQARSPSSLPFSSGASTIEKSIRCFQQPKDPLLGQRLVQGACTHENLHHRLPVQVVQRIFDFFTHDADHGGHLPFIVGRTGHEFRPISYISSCYTDQRGETTTLRLVHSPPHLPLKNSVPSLDLSRPNCSLK
jgi:hypothetical protein